MKISELAQIASVRRDIRIPLAIQGENKSITMGQILDSLSRLVVPFQRVSSRTESVQYSDGTGMGFGYVIFDTVTNNFYFSIATASSMAGILVETWTYYRQWDTKASYYGDGGAVREDCLFRAVDGRLYYFDGETLKSAGLTDEQATQIRHSTPIEVASEEEMRLRIEAGEYEDGQVYFLAESE